MSFSQMNNGIIIQAISINIYTRRMLAGPTYTRSNTVDFNGSNTDGSFTTAVSNSFLSVLE